MLRRTPRSTRTDTLFPYTTRFRSGSASRVNGVAGRGFGGPFFLRGPQRWLAKYQPCRRKQDATIGTVWGRLPDDCGDRIHASLSEGLRSEEHTSELQSLMRISYAVFCLKKKKKNIDLQTQEC